MTYASGTSWPEVTRHVRLYLVGKPRRRTDREGWWVSFTDPVTKKRRQAKFEKERDAWAFSNRVEDDRDALRCGRLTERDVIVGARSLIPFADTIRDYRDYLKKKGTTEKHARETHGLLKRFHESCRFGAPAHITADGVSVWLDGFDSSETANTYLRRVKAYCNWLERAGYLAASPVKYMEPKKAGDPTHHARALSFDELDALLECDEIPEYRRLWYAMSARAGLRHNEIERVTWADVDLESGWLRIPASKTKTNTAADIPLPASLVKKLRENVGDDSDRVVPMRPRKIAWAADIKAAKIKKTTRAGNAYMKSLRKTYVTHLLVRTGGDISTVKNLARHSRVETTMRHYADPKLMDMAGAAALLDSKPSVEPKANAG